MLYTIDNPKDKGEKIMRKIYFKVTYKRLCDNQPCIIFCRTLEEAYARIAEKKAEKPPKYYEYKIIPIKLKV